MRFGDGLWESCCGAWEAGGSSPKLAFCVLGIGGTTTMPPFCELELLAALAIRCPPVRRALRGRAGKGFGAKIGFSVDLDEKFVCFVLGSSLQQTRALR